MDYWTLLDRKIWHSRLLLSNFLKVYSKSTFIMRIDHVDKSDGYW